MTDEHDTLPGLELEPAPGKRRRRRRRGAIEVLPSGTVRVRIRKIRLPDGRIVERSRSITGGRDEAWRLEEARRRVLPMLEREAMDLEAGIASFDAKLSLAEARDRLRAGRHLRWTRKDDPLWKRLRSLWRLPLASVDGARIGTLLGDLQRDGYSPAYVRSVWGLLRRLLGAAVAARMLARVPVLRRGALPSEVSSRAASRGMASEERHALFAAASAIDREDGGDLAVRLAFQLDMGLRPLECAWARLDDLREEEGRWWLYPRRAKGSGLRLGQGVDRLAVSAPLLSAILARWEQLPPRARALGLLFPIRMPRSVWAPRWDEARGVRAARRWITAAELSELRRRSGLADWTPYDLRHARMHELARAGASPFQIQQFGAWQSARMVSVYSGRVKDAHPAMLEGLAPLPGASPVRVILGGAHGANDPPSAQGPQGPAGSVVGAGVGAGGRGHAVGPDADAAPEWARLEQAERAELVAKVGIVLDGVAEWPSPRAWVAAAVRRLGLEDARALLADLRVVDLAGGLPDRAGELRGLVVVLGERVTPRRRAAEGVKRAPAEAEKSNERRRVGAGGGNRFTVISGDRAADDPGPEK